jgi:hypothetical protein
MEPIKAEQLSSSKWRVLAIPFGGPFKGKDFDGEYFSSRTDIKADWFRERPVLWHHAKDPELKDAALGTEGELTKEKDGWWAEVWLNRSSQYWARVDQLLQQGKVYASSGSMPHLVQKDHRTGEILVWPHIEQTLTPTPANPFSRVVPVKAIDDFTLAGISLSPAVRDLLSDLDSLSADLRHDLPSGGDDAAMARLEEASKALAELRASL